MNYVIIDLEFNNMREITKYYPDFYNEHPEYENMECPNEIIEIGAVKLDRTMKQLGTFKVYIKPKIFSILNPRITEITGIEASDLHEGTDFYSAMEIFLSFIGQEVIIGSWAKDDIAELIRNADYYNYNNLDWLKEYIDIQEYCTKVLAQKKPISLKNALDRFYVRINKDLHDALNDAIYTAEVFKRIYNDRIVKSYIIRDIKNMPSIEIRDYTNFQLDESKIDESCPKCREHIFMEYPLKLFGWRFIGLGSCEKCRSKILQKIVVKQTLAGDRVYVENKRVLSEREYFEYIYQIENNRIVNE